MSVFFCNLVQLSAETYLGKAETKSSSATTDIYRKQQKKSTASYSDGRLFILFSLFLRRKI